MSFHGLIAQLSSTFKLKPKLLNLEFKGLQVLEIEVILYLELSSFLNF